MTEKTRMLLLNAVERYRGDDHLRARQAFRGLTPEQMKIQHGQSGRTRQEILDSYEAHNAACDEAKKELLSL